MTETRFDLILYGKVETGYERDEVRRTLEDLFEFDIEDQTQLFSGKTIVLARSMDAATAGPFQMPDEAAQVARRN